MDNVGASSKPVSNAASVASEVKVTIATQTGIEEADKRLEMSNLLAASLMLVCAAIVTLTAEARKAEFDAGLLEAPTLSNCKLFQPN